MIYREKAKKSIFIVFLSVKIFGNYLTKSNNISFKGEFKLKEFDGIPCAYCACPMLSRKTIDDTFSPYYGSAKTSLDKAKAMQDYLKPFQKEVLNRMLKIRSNSNAQTDFQVFDEAKTASSIEVRNDLRTKYNQIGLIINSSFYEQLKQKFNSKKDALEEFLLKRRHYPDLYNFVYGDRWLGVRKWDKSIPAQKIKAIIKGTDSSSYSVAGYILDKIRTMPVDAFYKELFLQSESTIEHVKPKSENGANAISNYLLVCRKCNSERKAKSLSKFYKEHPEIKQNIDNQLETLSKLIPKLIRDRKLPEIYRDYTYAARENIAALSNNQLGYHEIRIYL